MSVDCGDSSCMFAPWTGGMRTNGGCRCFESFRKSSNLGERLKLRELGDELRRLRRFRDVILGRCWGLEQRVIDMAGAIAMERAAMESGKVAEKKAGPPVAADGPLVK